MTESYSAGLADTALLGETIGANLACTVARFGDQEALVDVPTGRRWIYIELSAEVDRLAPGPTRPGGTEGRPGRHLGT